MNRTERIASESWIAMMSNKVKSGGGINLAQGIPGFEPPAELLESLRTLAFENVHQYPAGNGYPKLVRLICDSYASLDSISPDEVLVVQGATEGVSLVYTFMKHRFGNEWSSMAFDPVYESYKELPKVFDNDIVKVPFAEGGAIDRAFVEEALENNNIKLVFVNSPGNPFGKIWSEDEFKWLFGLGEKYDFYILMDAVYKDLYFGQKPPYLPLGIPRGRLFYVNSFSKMLSITGWRVGYLIAEKSLMKDIRAIHDYTGLCAPSILQYAISEYLEKNDYGSSYLEINRNKLAFNYRFMAKELKRLGFSVENSGGGYFVWCKLPMNNGNGVEFSLDLYDQEKVGVVPGIHFSSEADYWIRINIAREHNELVEALLRIEKYLAKMVDNNA